MLERPRDVRHPFTSRPSSKLGTATAATGLGSIVLVVLFNALIAQGTELALWQELAFGAILLGLVAAFVMGMIAVFRHGERSWVVVVPTALISLVVVWETVQQLLRLVGLGGE